MAASYVSHLLCHSSSSSTNFTLVVVANGAEAYRLYSYTIMAVS